MGKEPVEGYLKSIPDPEEIHRRIAENIRQRQLLRQLLKLAEQQKRVEEVSSCK